MNIVNSVENYFCNDIVNLIYSFHNPRLETHKNKNKEVAYELKSYVKNYECGTHKVNIRHCVDNEDCIFLTHKFTRVRNGTIDLGMGVFVPRYITIRVKCTCPTVPECLSLEVELFRENIFMMLRCICCNDKLYNILDKNNMDRCVDDRIQSVCNKCLIF